MTATTRGPWRVCEECGAKVLGYYKLRDHVKTHPGLETRQSLAWAKERLAEGERQRAYYLEVGAALDGLPIGPLLTEKLLKEWEVGGLFYGEGTPIDAISLAEAYIRNRHELIAKLEGQLAQELKEA